MVKVRKARLSDVDEIVQLWKEFFDEHDNMVISGNTQLAPYMEKKSDADQKFRNFAKKTIRSRNGLILVADDDGKLVGYALSLIKKNIVVFELERYGYISDLFVKKEYRGREISSMFKDESMKWFKQKGLKHASIMVQFQNRRAHEIYRKWGFHDLHIELRRKI